MIAARAIIKRYPAGRGGVAEALRGLDFTAPDGQVTALLGPNGAGKTTALRILAGLERADGGTMEVSGAPGSALQARLGFFTDGAGLYPRLSGYENIAYHARLHGLDASQTAAAIARLQQPLGLDKLLPRRAESYSQGERMRVALARALVHAPRHVILDEPTNGLDLASVRRLRAFLRHLASPDGGGHCVLVSSHAMDEVARLADRVVIMAHGRAVACGGVAEIINQTGAADFEQAFARLAFGEGE